MKKIKLLLGLFTFVFLASSFFKGAFFPPPPVENLVPVLPETLYDYNDYPLPNYYNNNDIVDEDNTPNNNLTTDAGATLGRVLFYDKNMSFNNTIACASCHLQENAFTDPAQFSEGFDGGLTGRNSMSLAHAKYYDGRNQGPISGPRFFWDERAATLEDQVLMPIQDPVEMGMTLDGLIPKLETLSYYPDLFTDAFGDATINSDRVSRALAQFIRSMVSYQSKYDISAPNGNLNGPFPDFTPAENRGKGLFQQRCGNCHRTGLQVMDQARNNGLDATTTDEGLGAVTGNNNDDGKFKSPSLRNVAVTGPYMHDGRFETLEEVVDFYSTGVQDHPNLDNRLQNNNNDPVNFNFNQGQTNDLIAFMNTLTDNAFLTDARFADPFQELVLPVEWLGFDIEKNKSRDIVLTWYVGSELECDYYEVEHSMDGRTFKAFDKVSSSGLPTNQSYEATHYKAQIGVNYYRVKQVNWDGTSSYTAVKSIKIWPQAEIKVLPTLVQNNVTLTLGDLAETAVHLVMMDNLGRVTHEQTFDTGYADYQINVNDWEVGIYNLSFYQGGRLVKTTRVVKH